MNIHYGRLTSNCVPFIRRKCIMLSVGDMNCPTCLLCCRHTNFLYKNFYQSILFSSIARYQLRSKVSLVSFLSLFIGFRHVEFEGGSACLDEELQGKRADRHVRVEYTILISSSRRQYLPHTALPLQQKTVFASYSATTAVEKLNIA